jgi:DNA-binding HxlR family transcriptional regulator
MSVPCSTGEHRDHDVYAVLCPCRDIFDVLNNRWSALAIGALAEGPQRYGQLQRRLEAITPKVLTSTLRRLEAYHFVERPARTEFTASVIPIFRSWCLAATRLAARKSSMPRSEISKAVRKSM